MAYYSRELVTSTGREQGQRNGKEISPLSETASELYRPSDRRFVGEAIANFLRIEGATWSA
jgi:hypothetical protein